MNWPRKAPATSVSHNLDLMHDTKWGRPIKTFSYRMNKGRRYSRLPVLEHLAMIYQDGRSSLETVSRRMYQATYHLAAGQSIKVQWDWPFRCYAACLAREMTLSRIYVTQFVSRNICLVIFRFGIKGNVSINSGVPRNLLGGGFQQIQLRIEKTGIWVR